jgi:hypothetical protein
MKVYAGVQLVVMIALTAPIASAAAAGVDGFPGMALLVRVETHLQAQRTRLADFPSHEGLVFPVQQDRLLAFTERLYCFDDGRDFVVGTAYAPESHGGGVLALILDYWRPQGRAARLADRFRFQGRPSGVALADLYAGHRRQVFLPVPGRTTDAIEAALPESPQLPRLRFRHPASATAVETDAYKFLGVSIEHEPDLTAPWTNHVGQRLSAALLMRHVRDVYMGDLSTVHELSDHTNLHRVELLLAYHARGGAAVDPNAIKRRFLENELSRTSFAEEETEVIGHYVQSLGRLLADPSVVWGPDEVRRVRGWLAALDGERFADLGPIPLQHLAHLVAGLRDVSQNRAKLSQR